MTRVKSLMSAVEAAGFAMAPSYEDLSEEYYADEGLPELTYLQPDDALRNGHAAAASAPARLLSHRHVSALADLSFVHWLRDHFSGWWVGRAAA